jgi:hypothetical protein
MMVTARNPYAGTLPPLENRKASVPPRRDGNDRDVFSNAVARKGTYHEG